MICVYRDNLDGRCSAALVLQKHPDCKLQEIDYGQKFPFAKIKPNETVFLVDYSPADTKEFYKLLRITKDVIWIDHNVSAIKKFRKFYQVGGIRDARKAACVLTAEYLHPDNVVSARVKYIGDWDTCKFEFGDYTKYFCSGLLMFETKPDSHIWKDLFSGLTYFATEYGRIIWRYRTRNWANILRDRSYEVTFGGKLALACNFEDSCSFAFDSIEKNYDLFISFSYTGKVWKYNLYSKGIDVSKLAEEYGGGGNESAASFTAEYRIL